MKRLLRSKFRWPAASVLFALAVTPLLFAQEVAAPKNLLVDGQFHFAVIESFDAKYEGDTPGHIGRNGGLDNVAPLVALGDPVFRGEIKIGTVTRIEWGRATGSLEVAFDPEPNARVRVGETVWLKFGTAAG